MPGTGRWSIGRRWDDETMTTDYDDDDDDDDDDVGVCSVLVDEFNFWSKFTEETRVSELGKARTSCGYYAAVHSYSYRPHYASCPSVRPSVRPISAPPP